MKYLLSTAAVVFLALISVIAIAAEPELGEGASTERTYVFVYLILNEPERFTQADMGEAMQGHFDNMAKLADEEKLLIAGPLAEPRISPQHRGIFVLNTETIEEGRKIASTDPAVRAGIFKMEMYTFTTDAPLLRLPQMERDAEAARLADPDVPDEWVGRMFVLAVGDADAEVPESDAVLISAVMVGDDDETTKQLLFIDAPNAEIAAALPGFGAGSGWQFYGWYGSGEVANLDNDSEFAP